MAFGLRCSTGAGPVGRLCCWPGISPPTCTMTSPQSSANPVTCMASHYAGTAPPATPNRVWHHTTRVRRLQPPRIVYGITRRGYGASSHPESGYTAQRSADDVLQVLDSL